MAHKTLYNTLGLSSGASADEIKKAFRRLAKQYHPDKNPNNKKSEESFKEIRAAYSVLSNPNTRKEYDLKMRIAGLSNNVNSNISPAYGYAYNVVRNMDKKSNQETIHVEDNYKPDFSPLIISIIVALAFVVFIVLLKM